MSDYQKKLQDLLRELFQFDSADLDFGFYAVMNQKRDVIEKFISQDLTKLIEDGLVAVATQNRGELEAAFARARQTVLDSLGETAFDGETLQPHFAGTPAGKAYLVEKEKLDKAFVPEDVEAQIYNDLYTFFARYYQDGDFISQRRYGASDKYAVPYNGEEVHLHWANFDQYYVKTGVHFQNYAFVVPGDVSSGDTSVQVRLTKVDVPRDNVKGEKRFFVYSADLPVEWDEEKKTLVIPMEYRPLMPEESSVAGKRNQQEKLLEAAYDAILAVIPNKILKARLMEVDPNKKTEKDRLAYHLNRYAAENTRDFFVHKDLGGFLRREFDYYLKAEVLRLEDIDFSDTIFAERKAAQLKTTRHIGEAIIRFLDQLERFQKQLFLKKKFVLQSEYCLTLDKIPAEKRAEFYPAILANERQLAEWERLYGVTVTAQTNLDNQPHLILDTAFFDLDFKYKVLSCLVDLDNSIDGLLIHSENFQALQLINERYQEQINCIYIDPPYNTGGGDFLYKDQFQHSTWLSMMFDRMQLARQILSHDGATFINIDDDEQARLKKLLDNIFQEENFVANIIWQKKYAPQNDAKWLSDTHDHILLYANDKEIWRPQRLPRTKEQNKLYKNPDDDPRGRWASDNYLSNKSSLERPNLYYPITNPKTNEEIWPPKASVWRYTKSQHDRNAADNRVWWGADGTNSVPRFKRFLSEVGGIAVKTIWEYKHVGHNQDGVRELQALFGSNPFPSPKPINLIQNVIYVGNGNTVLDFFAGSGTTGHSILKLSKEEKRLKYILVEMGEYFDSVLKPRIQKVAFADEWKDGKPVLPENGQTTLFGSGQSHMFHYLRLESYDDTFHNIRFREDSGSQMKLFDETEYLLGYMLDHETVGSPTLLDVAQFKRPFAYKLLVTGEDGVLREQPVDLVTTFNFLLGLSVQTIRRYEAKGNPYVRVLGTTPEGSQVCVLWRNGLAVEELDEERAWVLAHVLHDVVYDKLYVNGETTLPGALLIEDAFKRRMFEGVA